MSKSKKIVFVGMSGGVDSSVSATLLQQQGYEVVGVFIRTWHPEFLKCTEEEERRDAMRVCAHLNIPFLTFPFEDVYKKEVADYMISEYKKGRTPNPDVMCNQYVKFGVFLEKALSMGADYVATGHYATKKMKNAFVQVLGSSAQNSKKEQTQPDHLQKHFSFLLGKGTDPSKDQSYFLWTLKQAQLSKILFPIGHLKKTQVRKLAQKFKLPVAEKKDSQGICFLGAVDLKAFLKHYIKEKKGKVLDEKGEEIGYHTGVFFYTIGERHGFTITKKKSNDQSYYVIGKDIKKNILKVSQDRNISLIRANKRIVLNKVNWVSGSLFNLQLSTFNLSCQIRYHGEFLSCKIKCLKSDLKLKRAEVIFKKPVLVASGQSVVIYDKDICIGGGVII